MRFHSLFLVTFYSKPEAAHVPYFCAWRMLLSQGCFHHLLWEGILAVCDVREALEPPGLRRGFGPLGCMILPASLAGVRMMMTSVDTASKRVACNRLGGAAGGGMRTVSITYLLLKGEPPLSSRHVNRILKK